MNTTRICGCKSFRKCRLCEDQFELPPVEQSAVRLQNVEEIFYFCIECNKAFPGQTNSHTENHFGNEGINISGIFIFRDFLSEAEESEIVFKTDEIGWTPSQSGRRKQNFGPKTNFKKAKISHNSFNGFPAFCENIHKKVNEVEFLKDYKVVEHCALEYTKQTGACIDPHVDDCWVWGERVISVSLLSDSILTLIPHQGDTSRYNLSYVSQYPAICDFDEMGKIKFIPNDLEKNDITAFELKRFPRNIAIKVPMPRRSLLVLYGSARYNWEHCILRDDIWSRRICVALREFPPNFLFGGINEKVGEEILEKARNYYH